MADAPPWHINFALLHYYFILLCPIIIAQLLALLPSHVHDLARCSCIRQHVSMRRHLQVHKHYPPPRKKKVRPRLPSTLLIPRGNQFEREDAAPMTPRLTVFAVGWFLYVMSCRVKMFCHRATFIMTGHSRALRRYQACSAHVETRAGANTVRFDSDSYPIGVDGHASCCMGNHPDQFEDLQLTTDGKSVTGIGSSVIIKGVGTFKFNIEDDTGQVHTIRIPNSMYVPSLKRVLLSPHHWAQEAHDNHPKRRGTFMAQYDDGVVLHWNQRQYSRSVSYLPSTNTPVFHSAPDARSYRTYVAVIEALRACTPHFRREQVIQRTNQLPTTPEDDVGDMWS